MGWIGRAASTLAALIVAAIGGGPLARAADKPHLAESPVGKQVENFSLPDFHGRTRWLADYPDQLVVLVFLGVECPLVKTYAPRLRELAAEFEPRGVKFLAVDSNVQDSLTELAQFSRSYDLTFPLLKDNNNLLADRLGALRTPEVFLLDRTRTIRYWGRIDDQHGFKSGAGYSKIKPSERLLANAIGEVLAGKPVSQPVARSHGCFIGRINKTAPHGDVTYSKQIARIFQEHCVECHRAGEAAPFVMTSYDDVVGWGETIREVVQEGRMPPWSADPHYGRWVNDLRLSDEEKRQICDWVENGCPAGDAKELPPPRQFVEGWQTGEPDQIIYTSEAPFTVPAEGDLKYQTYVVDPGWTTDKWIQSIELRPGNRAIVHHMRTDVRPADRSDAHPREIGSYVPGTHALECPPGTAFRIPAYSKLAIEVHYTPNGIEQTDRSMIGIHFADVKKVKKRMQLCLIATQAFSIPPGASNYEARTSHRFAKDALLLRMRPHMHLRGNRFRFEAEYSDGKKEVLLNVLKYDFNWQYEYILAEPKLMPKGSALHCYANFDNSADNPANPDPTKTVNFGFQSEDEMLQGIVWYMDAGLDAACLALTSLSIASQADNAAGPAVCGAVSQLFESGIENTPAAVARKQYEQLKSSWPKDRRLDYAYAVVLANQGQHREALTLLESYLKTPHAEATAHCIRLGSQAATAQFADILPEAKALGDRFPEEVLVMHLEERPEARFSYAAQYLGATFAYLELARPATFDASEQAAARKHVLSRMGALYHPDFQRGEETMRSLHSSAPAAGPGFRATLSTYVPLPYDREKKRVLAWFAH